MRVLERKLAGMEGQVHRERLRGTEPTEMAKEGNLSFPLPASGWRIWVSSPHFSGTQFPHL
jgi:hypothetical protein